MAHILIVDDDTLVRQLLHMVLGQLGHDVIEAKSGREGLQLYRARPIDMVITDIQMPEMDGLEMIQEIRAGAPEAIILAMSGGLPSALNVAETLGVQGTFEKPFSLILLSHMVQELLQSPCQVENTQQ